VLQVLALQLLHGELMSVREVVKWHDAGVFQRQYGLRESNRTFLNTTVGNKIDSNTMYKTKMRVQK